MMLSHLSEETTGYYMIIVTTIVEQAEKYPHQPTRLCSRLEKCHSKPDFDFVLQIVVFAE